jgi:hypothetical protein
MEKSEKPKNPTAKEGFIQGVPWYQFAWVISIIAASNAITTVFLFQISLSERQRAIVIVVQMQPLPQADRTGQRRNAKRKSDISPNIVRVIESRRMRWAGHVARMG